MSLRNLFKKGKWNNSKTAKYGNDLCPSLLDEKLSLLKPSKDNIIKTDFDEKASPSTETPFGAIAYGSASNLHRQNDSYSTLTSYGYKITKLIRNTCQGQIFEASSIKIINNMERFVIKKVERRLFSHKIAQQYDQSGSVCAAATDKNILKEALLLNHCTLSNTAPGLHIAQFIEYFHDEKYYYLVMEHVSDINLADWVKTAFKYIKSDILDLKHYRKTIKFIFWQLSVLVYWLHSDMNVCHLSIKMENIMVKNGDFGVGADGMISINPRINIKLCDFSLAEIFSTGYYVGKSCKNDFECAKKKDISQYSAPNIFEMETYDAQKADIWSMGILLYKLVFGDYSINNYNMKDMAAGLWPIDIDALQSYIKVNNLSKYMTQSLFALICGMLTYDEKRRFDALKTIQSKWMDAYWQKYKMRITKKSFAQREELQTEYQRKTMIHFPYYQK